MTSFALPYITTHDIETAISHTTDLHIIPPHINESVYRYLSSAKKQISLYSKQWDNIKKYTNPYEFIHTPIPMYNSSISSYKPLSRSYFKMIEIINIYNLFKHYSKTNLTSFHLAEGPGGFIEAFVNSRNNPNDTYYGITLLNNNNDVPGWKKSIDFLKNNKNIILEYGADGTGDLMNSVNLQYCNEKYENTIDIITADGGFDFSIDYNHQESVSLKLIFAQVSFAIAMQKIGGHFVLKMFDLFTKPSIDLLYILSSVYKKVIIVKPNTSRYANSEKYIICKHFQLTNRRPLLAKLIDIHRFFEQNLMSNYISNILNIELPYIFINKLEEANTVLGQQQIENIITTIELLENNNKQNKLSVLKKTNIQKCINWCIKYHEPYHKNMKYTNIFLSNDESNNY